MTHAIDRRLKRLEGPTADGPIPFDYCLLVPLGAEEECPFVALLPGLAHRSMSSNEGEAIDEFCQRVERFLRIEKEGQ